MNETPVTLEIDGVQYTTRQVHDLRKPEPTPNPLSINTLGGFVDYVKEAKHDPAIIHIQSHRDVHLISPLFGRFQQRHVFASATFIDIFGQGFTFNNFFDTETFIISLLTLFEDTPDRATILSLVGNISDENVQTHADNGVTQTVTARTGIALARPVPAPTSVSLRPYRTFREIEQPESKFVLRMKQNPHGERPLCALFESDGGTWKLVAIARIRDFLNQQELGIRVIA